MMAGVAASAGLGGGSSGGGGGDALQGATPGSEDGEGYNPRGPQDGSSTGGGSGGAAVNMMPPPPPRQQQQKQQLQHLHAVPVAPAIAAAAALGGKTASSPDLVRLGSACGVGSVHQHGQRVTGSAPSSLGACDSSDMSSAGSECSSVAPSRARGRRGVLSRLRAALLSRPASPAGSLASAPSSAASTPRDGCVGIHPAVQVSTGAAPKPDDGAPIFAAADNGNNGASGAGASGGAGDVVSWSWGDRRSRATAEAALATLQVAMADDPVNAFLLGGARSVRFARREIRGYVRALPRARHFLATRDATAVALWQLVRRGWGGWGGQGRAGGGKVAFIGFRQRTL